MQPTGGSCTRPFVATSAERSSRAPRAGIVLAALVGLPSAAAGETDAEIARVLGLSNDVDWGEYLAGECVTCHAADAAGDAEAPRIHGADAAHLVRALLDYRGGVRTNTTMGSVAGALGDDEIAALAHHLSSAGVVPAPAPLPAPLPAPAGAPLRAPTDTKEIEAVDAAETASETGETGETGEFPTEEEVKR